EGIYFATISYDPLEDLSSVVFDYRKGAHMAVTHLHDVGHRRIGYLTQDVKAASAFPRFDGYMKALRAVDLPVDLDLVVQCGQEPEDVARAMAKLVALDDPPTAILSFNYMRALRAEAWCLEQGLQIPNDMAIVCFDNTWDTAHCTVPLTTIDLHWQREGAEAVKLVLEMVRTGDTTPRHVFVEPELVVRDSTRTV
ncbi:MAG: LacI family DNA-binding transcriptional regulator, partial [Planctomycetota bacterium]